ncbi:MAG: MFS transporter [Dehalococcoidia bacterium]|nr:MFS transporter [Dehalococcoidia bacterium]
MTIVATKKSGLFYGYVIVVASFFIMIATYGTYFAFGVFFNPVLAEFGWTRVMTSGAFSLSMVVHGVLGIGSGVLTDKLGPKIVIAVSGLVLGLGYLLMSQVGNIWQLYLFYGVIVGIGMSAAWVSILSTVARWFVTRRNMVTGIVLTGTGVGALIAPPIASRLISAYDWHWGKMDKVDTKVR